MVAPLDGKIGEALVKVDNLVGTGGPTAALATIQQLDPIGVDLQVSSTHLPKATQLVSQGLDIEVDLGDQRPKRLSLAIVDFIDNAVGRTTASTLPGQSQSCRTPEKTILPGEFAQLRISRSTTRKNAVAVPEKAVVQTQAGPTVYVVNDGKVGVAPVVVADDTYKGVRVVTSGLTAGQMVIVEGLQLVRPGAPVDDQGSQAAQVARRRPGGHFAGPTPHAGRNQRPRRQPQRRRPLRRLLQPRS